MKWKSPKFLIELSKQVAAAAAGVACFFTSGTMACTLTTLPITRANPWSFSEACSTRKPCCSSQKFVPRSQLSSSSEFKASTVQPAAGLSKILSTQRQQRSLPAKEQVMTHSSIVAQEFLQMQMSQWGPLLGLSSICVALGLGFGLLFHVDSAQALNLHKEQLVGDSNLRDLALGPEGPLVEEFWENMRRYGLYFLTVATGGLYSILKPIVDLLKNPLTGVLALVVIVGIGYLFYLTLGAMLGIIETDYQY